MSPILALGSARTPRPIRAVVIAAMSIVVLASACPLALAQSVYQPAYQPAYQPTHASNSPFGSLDRVDPGIADIGPLNTSARLLPADLRLPVGFEHVYRMRGDHETLLRVSGGLAATFPRSQYNSTRDGLFPQIPAGTVFHIGGVRPRTDTPGLASTSPIAPAFNAIDRNASGGSPTAQATTGPNTLADTRARDTRLPSPLPTQRPDAPADPANIWNDEVYRALRVRELLRQSIED